MPPGRITSLAENQFDQVQYIAKRYVRSKMALGRTGQTAEKSFSGTNHMAAKVIWQKCICFLQGDPFSRERHIALKDIRP